MRQLKRDRLVVDALGRIGKAQPLFVRPREERHRGTKPRIERNRPLQHPDRFGVSGTVHGIHQRQRLQVEVVSIETFGTLAARPLDLGLADLRLDPSDHGLGDLVLEIEDVGGRAVELLGPDMRAGDPVDQLRADANAVAGPPDAPFEKIPDAEFLRRLARVDRTVLEHEGRVASGHGEGLESRQRGDQVLDHAIREVRLLRVAREVGERQHRDQRPAPLFPSGLIRRS